MYKWKQLNLGLESLVNYRELLGDKVLSKLNQLINRMACGDKDAAGMISLYGELAHHLIQDDRQEEPFLSLSGYVLRRIYEQDTPFSRAAERVDVKAIPAYIMQAAGHDLKILERAASVTSQEIKQSLLELCEDKCAAAILATLPDWQASRGNLTLTDNLSWAEDITHLAAYHRKRGSGLFAQYRGFIWEGAGREGYLKGIPQPDPVLLEDFIGYEAQRGQLIENTLQFLAGHAVNNVLLYGDRGTGKSSTVKALLNGYHEDGLRMIEMPKLYLADLPEVIRMTRDRPQKFIVFIDDLAFDDDEEHYTALKAVLEGGLESRPGNLVIYATSNRRHLIRERFSDRKGLLSDNPYEEVHASDTIQEKLSLADRFGMTITFESPDQERYLAIVNGLLEKRGIILPEETVRREAIRWEMRYNGRSPRTARQFIQWIAARYEMDDNAMA